MTDRDERLARRALRRAARAERREGRQEARAARREVRPDILPTILAALCSAAEVLLGAGAGESKLGWVIDQITDFCVIPGVDDDALDEVLEDAISAVVARLF